MLPKWYIDFVESRKWYLNDYNDYNIPGWWLSPTPLKNDGVKVSWDDDIPKIWTNNPNVPNHQEVILLLYSMATLGT